MLKNLGLYIHIPFCLKKCSYCDFYSVAYDTITAQRYVEKVAEEIINVADRYRDYTVDTVFFGGGTPSVLPSSLIAKIVETINANFNINNAEISIEVNPCSADKLSDYKSIGINRISFGVQSLNDNILKLIGRLHSSSTAIDALVSANKYFNNISADLMIGLPTQTENDVMDALVGVLPYVSHISQYMLKLSGDVPMQKAIDSKELTVPDDDTTVDMYDCAYEYMQSNGYKRYEISNFARDNKVSRHNIKYWTRENYIGVGAAAHSFIDNIRYDNPTDLYTYFSGENFGNNKAHKVAISQADAMFEEIMLSFRLTDGLDIKHFNNKFGVDFRKLYKNQLIYLEGILLLKNGRAFIKEDKMLLESAVARVFLP